VSGLPLPHRAIMSSAAASWSPCHRYQKLLRAQACVHDYMKRRRRTENVRKREELEAERLAHEPDNLAVLAQVGLREHSCVAFA
jgi:hypothetical protein